MEELEDDPSSEMLAIEPYRPAVYAACTFDFNLCRLTTFVRVLCRFIVPPPTVSMLVPACTSTCTLCMAESGQLADTAETAEISSQGQVILLQT